jgi:hypothetical protein
MMTHGSVCKQSSGIHFPIASEFLHLVFLFQNRLKYSDIFDSSFYGGNVIAPLCPGLELISSNISYKINLFKACHCIRWKLKQDYAHILKCLSIYSNIRYCQLPFEADTLFLYWEDSLTYLGTSRHLSFLGCAAVALISRFCVGGYSLFNSWYLW